MPVPICCVRSLDSDEEGEGGCTSKDLATLRTNSRLNSGTFNRTLSMNSAGSARSLGSLKGLGLKPKKVHA